MEVDPAPEKRRRRQPGVDVRPGSIRQARQEAGLSLARLAGDEISRGAIYLIESGRSRPSMTTLNLIAARTHKPVSFFLASDDQRTRTGAADEVAACERLLAEGRHDEVARRASAVLESQVEPLWQVRARLCLARASLGTGEPEQASLHLERAREELRGLDDPWAEVECQVLLARAAYLTSEDHRELALSHAALAIDAGSRLDPRPEPALARACMIAGDVLAEQGQWEAAVERFQEALQQATACSDLLLLSELHTRQAAAYQARGLGLLAAQHSARAGALREAWHGLGIVPEIHLKLATALRAREEGQAARQQLDRALRESERLRLTAIEGQVLLTRADWHLSAGELDAAEAGVEQAADLARRAGDRPLLARARFLEGRLAARRHDAGTRDRAFADAFELLVLLDLHDELVEAHVAYAELLEADGEVAEALEQWKQAMMLARPHLVHQDGPLAGASRVGTPADEVPHKETG